MRRPHAAAPANGHLLRQGVKANVLFFDRKPPSETPWTKKLWIYDLRTNQHFTLKTRKLAARRPRRLRRLLQPGQPPRREPRPIASMRSATTSCWPATRRASTSSGSGMSRWRTLTTSRPRRHSSGDRRGPAGSAGPVCGCRVIPGRQRKTPVAAAWLSADRRSLRRYGQGVPRPMARSPDRSSSSAPRDPRPCRRDRARSLPPVRGYWAAMSLGLRPRHMTSRSDGTRCPSPLPPRSRLLRRDRLV